MKKQYRISLLFLSLLMVSSLACAMPGMAQPTPKIRYITWTPKPTNTAQPTETPSPSATFTPSPSETPTLAVVAPAVDTAAASSVAITQPAPATAPVSQATISDADAIKVYYYHKGEPGQFGCGEMLRYVKTNKAKSTDLAGDIRFALSLILNYHNEMYGTLYNPGWASTIAVNGVKADSDAIVVSLGGTWTPTDDRCDGKRFIDQIRQTIRQFGVANIQVTLNGSPIGDAISRK